MNTMIPNKLKFDLDLNDLPARVTQVSSEALSLSAAGRLAYVDSGLTAAQAGQKGFKTITILCESACRRANTQYYKVSNYIGITSLDNYDGTVRCGCVFG
jgi:N-acetylmuramic acid 6-phosphate (MurNAc-6-P) etherase